MPLAFGSGADDVDRLPEGVTDDRLLARLAGELLVVLDLEAAEPLVVGAGEADHLGGNAALWIGALLLRIVVHAGEGLLHERLGLGRVGEALDVDERRLAVQELRIELVRVDAEDPVGRDRHGPGVRQLAWVGVDRLRLLADRELYAVRVEDGAAPGRDHDRLAMLPFGHSPERCGANALEPDGSRERRREDEREDHE